MAIGPVQLIVLGFQHPEFLASPRLEADLDAGTSGTTAGGDQ